MLIRFCQDRLGGLRGQSRLGLAFAHARARNVTEGRRAVAELIAQGRFRCLRWVEGSDLDGARSRFGNVRFRRWRWIAILSLEHGGERDSRRQDGNSDDNSQRCGHESEGELRRCPVVDGAARRPPDSLSLYCSRAESRDFLLRGRIHFTPREVYSAPGEMISIVQWRIYLLPREKLVRREPPEMSYRANRAELFSGGMVGAIGPPRLHIESFRPAKTARFALLLESAKAARLVAPLLRHRRIDDGKDFTVV